MTSVYKFLLRTTTLVGAMTLISRVLGLVRDVLIARLFGAGIASDAFFVAFKIPNFFRRLFAEGAFSQAFIPVLTEHKQLINPREPGALIGSVFGLMSVALFAIVLVGILSAPIFILIFAPGFVNGGEKFELSVLLLRITFPYLLFISLTALLGGALNVYRRFAVPALTPALLNVSLILCAICLSPRLDEPIVGLAIGVLVGGGCQLVMQYLAFRGLKIEWKVRFRADHSGVRQIFKLMVPAIFGVSVAQINLIVDMVIASFLITGSISWLYYSDRIIEFPLGIFGIAMATAILPTLSKQASEKDSLAFRKTIGWSMRWVWLIGVPAAAGTVILAAPILTTLFAYGEMGQFDIMQSTQSLAAYAIGLPAFICIKVLAPGYFARQDTVTPVKIGIIALLTNIVLNLVLVSYLDHVGLALATSLSAWLNATLLWVGLKKKDLIVGGFGGRLFLLRVFLATGLMVIVANLFTKPSQAWLYLPVLDRVTELTLAVLIAMVVYFGTLLLSGLKKKEILMQ